MLKYKLAQNNNDLFKKTFLYMYIYIDINLINLHKKNLKTHKSNISKLMKAKEKEMNFNFVRYKQGEKEYKKLSDIKKIKNLIEYLLSI